MSYVCCMVWLCMFEKMSKPTAVIISSKLQHSLLIKLLPGLVTLRLNHSVMLSGACLSISIGCFSKQRLWLQMSLTERYLFFILIQEAFSKWSTGVNCWAHVACPGTQDCNMPGTGNILSYTHYVATVPHIGWSKVWAPASEHWHWGIDSSKPYTIRQIYYYWSTLPNYEFVQTKNAVYKF